MGVIHMMRKKVLAVALSGLFVLGGLGVAHATQDDNPDRGQSKCEWAAIHAAQDGLTAALAAGRGGSSSAEKAQRVQTRAVRASLPGIETTENDCL
jgi:hypothetical protein